MVNLNLKVFEHANLCGNDCEETMDDGKKRKLDEKSIVACIGCGRKCHMECHKVPRSLSEGVKKVPKNNRVNALFGDCSYMRLVCENCAIWLMLGVPPGATPSFTLMFSTMVKKLINDMYVLKSEASMEAEDTAENEGSQIDGASGKSTGAKSIQNGRKRKKPSDDDSSSGDDCAMSEMYDMLMSITKKLDNMEKQGNDCTNKVLAKLTSINGEQTAGNGNIESKLSKIQDEVKVVNGNILKFGGSLDSSKIHLENGLQKGFNSLWDKTEKLLSPRSPSFVQRRVNPFSIRKAAIMNSTVSDTPRPSTSLINVSNAVSGSSSEQNIFGGVVPRRLFGNMSMNKFEHERAVVVSYVDPTITMDKMMDILRKSDVIDRAVGTNDKAVEIIRLTKRHLSEDDVRRLKFGVSYRIGACEEICLILLSGALFAPHWEVREWVDKDKGDSGGDNRSTAQTRSDSLRDNGVPGNTSNFLQPSNIVQTIE